MKEREKRISAFIESLPALANQEIGESIILTTDMESVGGENKGNCVNHGDCRNQANTGTCRNYDPTGCENSINGKRLL